MMRVSPGSKQRLLWLTGDFTPIMLCVLNPSSKSQYTNDWYSRADILRYINTILQPLIIYPKHHCWSGVQRSYCTTHDSPAVCSCLRCHAFGIVFSRPFQCVRPPFHLGNIARETNYWFRIQPKSPFSGYGYNRCGRFLGFSSPPSQILPRKFSTPSDHGITNARNLSLVTAAWS